MTFPSALSRGALLLILTATVAQAPPPPPSTPSPDELQFGRALAGEDYSFSFAYEAVADPSTPEATILGLPTSEAQNESPFAGMMVCAGCTK